MYNNKLFMENQNEIILTVIMFAYNHEKYVSRALESVLEQKTNYKYEIIIHDDASTDKTAQIIREYEKKYPHIIIALYEQENQYSQGRSFFDEKMLPISKGKYIIVLECDDYWSDSNKLQKQIDFLEKNTDYIGCTHNCYVINEFDQKIQLKKGSLVVCKEHVYKRIFSELSAYFPGPTAAKMYKKELYDFKTKSEKEDFYNIQTQGDVKTNFLLTLKGSIYYFSDMMSVYRRVTSNGTSWSASNKNNNRNDKRYISSIQMRRYAKKYYNTIYKNYYITLNAALRGIFLYIKNPTDNNKAVLNNIIHYKHKHIVGFILYLILISFPSLILFFMKKIYAKKIVLKKKM